jgi:phospholipid transport system substrate-binding protein
MRISRPLAWFLALGCSVAARALPAEPPPAAATVQGLCDALISVMKEGPATTFVGREEALAPEIRLDFDLAAMSRIVVGPAWRSFSAGDKQEVTAAFSDYSIASYAQRFKGYSGERFEVDPVPSALPNGDCIVHTKLHTGDPEPVQLDYMMRVRDGRWRIIDVFLSGTISELAARRSEYSLVLRTGGSRALVDLLRKKTAELGR